ncbi:hypothetical protein PUN28_017475 [Cardiocondyla obscurior]|uniref:Uncharacterized protein n=1 Tax=Cardiocondyla obscurior TaxID=286306 RepID=A0AAW2EM71_9HYME
MPARYESFNASCAISIFTPTNAKLTHPSSYTKRQLYATSHHSTLPATLGMKYDSSDYATTPVFRASRVGKFATRRTPLRSPNLFRPHRSCRRVNEHYHNPRRHGRLFYWEKKEKKPGASYFFTIVRNPR